jgi:Concanavalin A-like lectin/glucanases superfamily/Immunoglobulin domain/Legume lectin domain/Immunoglobulin I-set domain
MKNASLCRIVLLLVFSAALHAFSWPVYEPFNYPPGQTVWGQYDTNTQDYWMEIDSGASAPNAISIVNQSLTYPGLPASPGYSFLMTNVNGAQGARMFITSNSFNWPGNAGGSVPGPIGVYYSLVMNVTNMAALWNNGSPSPQYCFGYNDQGSVAPQGGNPGTMLYRFYWLATSTNTYQVCLAKQGPGSADLFYATNSSGPLQLYANSNYFIVGCEVITNQGVGEPGGSPPGSQSDIAMLWVDPPTNSFGTATPPPVSSIENSNLENNLTPYTSCIIFENRSTATPVTLISQFRFGTNWSWVTGGPFIYNNQPGPVTAYTALGISLTATPYLNGSANTYQWTFNGTNLTNGPSVSGSGATVSGANTTALVVSNATVALDSGSYEVVVANALGSYTSAVSVVTVQPGSPPAVTVEPSPATVLLYPGGSTYFSFSAIGTPPIVYYWHSNNTVVGVTTNLSTFLYSNVQATASIYCLASNQVGSTYTVTNTIQVLPLPTAPYPRVVINDKPIGFWPLNEHPDNGSGNGGTLALDYMGGNDGVYSNTTIAQPGYGAGLAGQYGYGTPSDTNTSVEFGAYPAADSTNSYVGGIPNIDFTASQDSPSFSVEAWVNAQGNSEGTSGAVDPAGTIVAKGWGTAGAGADEFALEYSGSSAGGGVGWSFYCRDQSGIPFFATSNSSLDANWHHIVGVFDPLIATLFLYVDGAVVASNVNYATTGVGTNTIGIYASTFPLTIGSAGSTQGAATNGPDKEWFGNIADVAIYKYALTANQVSNHYWSAGLPPVIVSQPPVVQVSYGSTLNLPVTVAGTAPLSFEWIDGNTSTPIPGQTNATLVVSNVTANDAYTLQVTSPYGTNTGVTDVNVILAPTVVQDISPNAAAVVVGNTVTFAVGVDGAPPVTYWWQVNGTNLSANPRFTGTASNVLTINNVQLGDAGSYQLFASNAYGGPVTSSSATLTVTPFLGFSGGTTWSTESSVSSPYAANNELDLTSGGTEDTASFFQYPVYIQGFYANFTYQVGSPDNSADGASFCIQNDPRGAAAEGEGGAGLGVGATSPPLPPDTSPITPSFELELNIWAANGIGGVGIALGTNGSIPEVTSTSPVVINSGDAIDVALEYVAGVLTVNLTDSSASTQFTLTTHVNIPALVGGSSAYVGFTGSAGGSVQTVTDFSFQSIPVLAIQKSGNQAVLSWPTDVGYFVLQHISSLTSTNWVNVTNVPALVSGQNEVVVPAAQAAQYYRLSAQ